VDAAEKAIKPRPDPSPGQVSAQLTMSGSLTACARPSDTVFRRNGDFLLRQRTRKALKRGSRRSNPTCGPTIEVAGHAVPEPLAISVRDELSARTRSASDCCSGLCSASSTRRASILPHSRRAGSLRRRTSRPADLVPADQGDPIRRAAALCRSPGNKVGESPLSHRALPRFE
jgi:hypothetical protein